MTDPTPFPIEDRSAIIVCGGRSERFGSDKALARMDGRTFLEIAITAAGAATAEVILATGAEPRYEEFGLPIALDAVPDGGPLAGIAAGLEIVTRPSFLVMAVDLPFVTPLAIETLFGRLSKHNYAAPWTPRGPEPLFSVGRTEPCRSAARVFLHSNRPAAHRFCEMPGAVVLDIRGDKDLPIARALRNVNRPGDLDAVQ